MAINRHYGTNMVDAGVSRRPMSLNGTLHNRVGLALATPGTIEASLLTLEIPGGVINTKGKGLRIRVIATVGGAGGTKTIRLRRNTLAGTLIADGGASANGNNWLFDASMFLVDESTGGWEGYGWLLAPTTVAGGSRVSETTDVRNDWNLVVTGQSPNGVGDLILRSVRVDMITEGGLTPG